MSWTFCTHEFFAKRLWGIFPFCFPWWEGVQLDKIPRHLTFYSWKSVHNKLSVDRSQRYEREQTDCFPPHFWLKDQDYTSWNNRCQKMYYGIKKIGVRKCQGKKKCCPKILSEFGRKKMFRQFLYHLVLFPRKFLMASNYKQMKRNNCRCSPETCDPSRMKMSSFFFIYNSIATEENLEKKG